MLKRGQVEHILTMVNMKLKPSLFTPHPNVQNFIISNLYNYIT